MNRACAGRGATPVSGAAAGSTPNRWVSALARLSLPLSSVLMVTGCLIDDPPPYAPPKQTPPRLEYHRAFPPLDRIIVARESELLPFSIPVTSEDAGEGLQAQLLVGEISRSFKAIPPATLDDPPREISFDYQVSNDVRVGCHRIRIRVAHVSNLPDGDGAPLDSNDLAEAYWLALLNVPPDQIGVGLEDCLNREPSGK